MSLFPEDARGLSKNIRGNQPLAAKLRPFSWEEFQGLEALDKNLISQFKEGMGRPPSLLLWGPPGSGKTTLARLIGHTYKARFAECSGVMVGVKEIREIANEAARSPLATILFVDEIHRLNKGQQDAFLPHVEDGTFSLIGATTENPSFYVTNALLSRLRVVVLSALSSDSLERILERALTSLEISMGTEARTLLCHSASGDARRMLNMLEDFSATLGRHERSAPVTKDRLSDYMRGAGYAVYDRAGEEHYNLVSAFIKSMRGSDPDAALYYCFRMIEGGEDPRFVIRRMMIFASEDIGNADPRALPLAVATAEAFDRLGLPEGKIPIAHCVTYLSSAPKSNRSYVAMGEAIQAVRQFPHAPVPLHLRNAPTALMKDLDYGKGYQYPHNHEEGVVSRGRYLPDELGDVTFYRPSPRGFEGRLKGER